MRSAINWGTSNEKAHDLLQSSWKFPKTFNSQREICYKHILKTNRNKLGVFNFGLRVTHELCVSQRSVGKLFRPIYRRVLNFITHLLKRDFRLRLWSRQKFVVWGEFLRWRVIEIRRSIFQCFNHFAEWNINVTNLQLHI